MSTTLQMLRSVNAYPIPLQEINSAAVSRGLDLTLDATVEVIRSKAYNLTRADLLLWVSLAPDVIQGGQNYSLSDGQRTQLRNHALSIYDDFGVSGEASCQGPIYGYKGSRL